MLTIFKEGFQNLFNNIKNHKIKLEIANLLTLSRLLSPFVLIPLVAFDKKVIFIIMIIIFSLTDTFDGYFARKYNSSSRFGEYLDAFVDKIYAASLLFPIILFPWIDKKEILLVLIIILLELLISILNLYSFYHKLNPKSTIIGKFKTIVLFIALGFVYLKKINIFYTIPLIYILVFTIIFQGLAIFSYLIKLKDK